MKIFLFKILLLEKELERALQEWVKGEIEKLSNRTDCPFIKDEIYNLIQEIKLQASYLNDKVIFGMIETWIGLVPRHVFQLMRTEDNFVFNYAEMAQIMIQAKSLTASEKFSAEIKVGNRKFYLVEEDKELINEVENKIEQEVIIIPDKDSTKEKLEERKSASFDRVSMHQSIKDIQLNRGSVERDIKFRIYILTKSIRKNNLTLPTHKRVEAHEILKSSYASLESDSYKKFSPEDLSKMIDEFLNSLSWPLFVLDEDYKNLKQYFEIWLLQNDQAEISFHRAKNTENERITIFFPSGFKREVFCFQNILNQNGNKVYKSYVNKMIVGTSESYAVTLYFQKDLPQEKIDEVLTSIREYSILPDTPITTFFAKEYKNNKLNFNEIFLVESIASLSSQLVIKDNQALERIKKLPVMGDNEASLQEDITELASALRQLQFPPHKVRKAFIDNPISTHYLIEYFRLLEKGIDQSIPENQEKIKDLKDHVLFKLRTDDNEKVFQFAIDLIESLQINIVDLPQKVAMAFSVNPQKLFSKYPLEHIPTELIYVRGRGFNSCYIGFGEYGQISRGGHRLLVADNEETAQENFYVVAPLAKELGTVQHGKNLKNPEGGSKVVTACDLGKDEVLAFKQSSISIINLMMRSKPHRPFELGPDMRVSSAMVGWAMRYAKKIGYAFAFSFYSGRSEEDGGYDHKANASTIRGIHTIMRAHLTELGKKEEETTMAMWAGPGGDLGGNNILYYKGKLTLVRDLRAMLHEPLGADRNELLRLKNLGLGLEHFNPDKVSKSGMLVFADERNYTLNFDDQPEPVSKTGLQWFREVMGYVRADMFIPCASDKFEINQNNYRKFFDDQNKPRIPFVAEGGNLVFSKAVYRLMQELGMTIFWAETANQSGVNGSSYDVIPSYVFSSQKFMDLMFVKNGQPTPFRKEYYQDVEKYLMAFNFQDYLLQRTMKIFHGMHETEAGALFAKKIVSKNSQILKNYHRDLISRELEEIALRWYFPPVFVKEAGMENILQKLPQQGILRPAVSKILLTQFYYRYGLMADETLFTVYLNQLSSGKITLPTVDEILKPRGINFVYEEGLQKGLTPVSK